MSTPVTETGLKPERARGLLRVALISAGVLAVGSVVAACGGSSTPGVATGSSTTTTIAASSLPSGGASATGLLAYSSCMRSHGVPKFPDPTSTGGIPKQGVISATRAVSSSQAASASTACAHFLPGGSLSGKASEPVPAADQTDYLKAVACLRSHGFANFPDPVFSGGGVHFDIPDSINTKSAQFDQAQRICRKFIPAGLPDSGS